VSQYKVCSTFDSSPTIGNMGRAIELGAKAFAQKMVPMIVGAPQLKRYTFAGHLFAGYQGETWRIDRHPVMSRHPVTPMQESDLRLHLAHQTKMPVHLSATEWPAEGIALIDVHDLKTQVQAGRRLIEWPGGFVVGSSGIQYALMAATQEGAAHSAPASFENLPAVERIAVVSGSVSPTTERQIKNALQNGFVAVPVDPLALARRDETAVSTAVQTACRIVSDGKSPLVYSALGPSTDSSARLNVEPNARKNIGETLGAILKLILERSNITRAIIAGGDSSSHALGQLDIYALTTRMPLPATPGSPMCTCYSGNQRLKGLELALKGGQVGADNYFSALRDGTC
jgi:3-oxoisoapionate kinase